MAWAKWISCRLHVWDLFRLQGQEQYIVNTMLCPHCGAKMDGKDGDDA